MRNWASFARKFGRLLTGRAAQFEITQAYRRVFLGTPSRQDQQMVLSDLAARCGWNTITPSSAASKELWRREGKREGFSEIWRHLTLSQDDIDAMDNAVRLDVEFNNQHAAQ